MTVRLLADRRGGSSIEFSIVASAFFVVLLGTVEFGRLMLFDNALSGATGETARVLLLDPSADPAALEAIILDRLPYATPASLAVTLSDTTENGITYRRLTARYAYEFLLQSLFPAEIDLRAERMIPNG